MKWAVVFNPTAGKLDQITELRAALDRWPTAELMASETPAASRSYVRQAVANGAELVVAAGGDGTVAEVVNALAGDFSSATLAVLPLGTGNDFARSIGLPLDLAGALAAIERGATRAIDVIRVTQPDRRRVRHFINIAASGFQRAVNQRVEEQFKRNWGPFGYLAAVAEALPEVTAYEMDLFLDDAAPIAVTASNLVVASGRYMAAGVPIAPTAMLNDGFMDVLAILTTTATELALMAPLLLLGTHVGTMAVAHHLARRLTLRSKPPIPFHVDGEEFLGDELRFEVLPGALRVIVGDGAAVVEDRR